MNTRESFSFMPNAESLIQWYNILVHRCTFRELNSKHFKGST